MIDFQFPNKKIQNQPSTDDRVNKIKQKTFKFKKKKKKKKNSQVEYEVLMIVLIYFISLILTIQNLKDSNK